MVTIDDSEPNGQHSHFATKPKEPENIDMATGRPISLSMKRRITVQAPDLAEAITLIERLRAVVEDLSPGVRHIALKNYAEFNDAMLDSGYFLNKIRSR